VTGRKAIFLDRDGVLNRTDVRNGKPYAPERVEDFELLTGTYKAVCALKDAGYILVVVTNQPDVGNGKVERSIVESMNKMLMTWLPLDVVKTCIHKQTDGCSCRKPMPGMLLEAARELGINLRESYMVGDRAGDIAAGKAAGCRTIFIDQGYGPDEKSDLGDFSVSSLSEAVNIILATSPGVGLGCEVI